MSVTEAEVRTALRGIPEPCSLLMRAPTNLVDMGLIDRVEISDGAVEVEMVLTDASCIHFASMQRFITDTLRGLDGVKAVNVTASTTVLWTPDRVTTPGHGTATPRKTSSRSTER
jgi:metal-sulfur cluster biosynthetic enzyme